MGGRWCDEAGDKVDEGLMRREKEGWAGISVVALFCMLVIIFL